MENNVANTSSKKALKPYTVGAPPEDLDGTIYRTKAEAEACKKLLYNGSPA